MANALLKFFVRHDEMNKGTNNRRFIAKKNFAPNQVLDEIDIQILGPFFYEVDSEIIDQVKCIYASGKKKSYLVKFRTGSEIWNGAIVIKGFLMNKKEQCEIETQNIRLISSINNRLPNSFVHIPKIVWSKPIFGLFATRWIPGEDMDSTIKKSSRLWTWESSQTYIQDFVELLEWQKCLLEVGQNEFDRNQAIKRNNESWEKFFVWFYEAEKFEYSWRMKMIARLEDERKWFDENKFLPGPYHNDFTPCNIRRDSCGNYWVLDWRWLEIGHWLEAAYQFSYALRRYSYSPLSRFGYFKSIYTTLENYLQELEPDDGTRRYYRLRTIMRYLFNHGKRPVKNLRSKINLRYWMRELTQHIT